MNIANAAAANVRQKAGKVAELDGIVGDVVSKIMEEEEKVEKLKRLENINKWFYRDPQGVVQGEKFEKVFRFSTR